MLRPNRWMARLLTATAVSAVSAGSVSAQVSELRKSDDQFIQGLREQGMSDLLDRFREASPPEDPVAKAALDVALLEFVADDLLQRAAEANNNGNVEEAIGLYEQSRDTFDKVLAAQRQLIQANPEDERMPLWETEFADMLLVRYLPRYFQSADWVYEFGVPSDEQREAYEKSMVEAYVVTTDAAYRLDTLANRAGADADLRPRLEALGIWYKLEDYRQLNTPYWLGRAAHGVSLLPDDAAYFQTKMVNNQKVGEPAKERQRLRQVTEDALKAQEIQRNDNTAVTANLFIGRTLVWSDDVDLIEDGVATYLDAVRAKDGDGLQGLLAAMATAVGRWNQGDLQTATEMLGGLANHNYVKQQAREGNYRPRLVSADLLFRILESEAKKAPAAQRSAKIAEAYETAYVPLIDGDGRAAEFFKQELFTRWAAMAGEVADPMSLPPAVRMGIGEQLTNASGFEAQQIVAAMSSPPVVPAENERWRAALDMRRADVEKTLNRAVRFNQTLVGDDMQGPILARGLYNLGFNYYWLASLEQAFDPKGNGDADKFLKVAELWLQVGQRSPDAPKAQEALTYAMSLSAFQDQAFNMDKVQRPKVREIFRSAFEQLNARWPNEQAVQDQRLYVGFYVYEKNEELDMAVECYRALPNTHKDYFQARRQMINVMQRQYRTLADQMRAIEGKQPAKEAPPAEMNQWLAERDRVRDDMDRMRQAVLEEARIVELDAQDAAENERDPVIRFNAATALGAAMVTLAEMEADEAKKIEFDAERIAAFKKVLARLDGFEAKFGPKGPFAALLGDQPNKENAQKNLRGLVQIAQQQRVLILLDARQTDDMANQVEVMMNEAPDVAAGMISGVLTRVNALIDRERRAEKDAAFDRQKQVARENIKFFAEAAVKLGEKLVEWAEKQPNFTEEKKAAYKMPLARALLLAERPKDALSIMAPLVEKFPNNFEVRMQAGKTYLALYQLGGNERSSDNYNAAMKNFNVIIAYYNQRPEKPDYFWDAWLHVCYLLETAGPEQAKIIPARAQALLQEDPQLGGPEFKPRLLEVFARNGGIQRLPKQ